MTALAALVSLTLLMVPGWLIARAWQVTGLRAWGMAPALSLGLLGVATLLPWQWTWQHALMVLLGGTMVLLIGGDALCDDAEPGGDSADRGESEGVCAASGRAALWPRCAPTLGLVAAMAATLLPAIAGLRGLETPAQASDAVYHLSAARFLRLEGDASPLGGLASMYDGSRVYYPTLWHAIVALLPGSVVQASTVLMLVTAGVIFPLTMAGLLSAMSRRLALPAGRRPRVLGAAIALIGSSTSVLLIATSVWPYTLAVSLLPAALTALIEMVPWGEERLLGVVRHSRWLLALLACAGVAFAHGAGVFSLIVLGLPPLGALLWPGLRALWGSWARVWLIGGGTLLLVATVAGVWLLRAPLASVFGYSRGSGNLGGTLVGLLTGHPQLGHYSLWLPGNLLVVLLGVVGGICAWRVGRSADLAGASSLVKPGSAGLWRAWGLSAAAALTLILLAGGPQWPLRILTGPWYTQRARLIPLLTIAGMVLVLLALARIDCWSQQRRVDGGGVTRAEAPGRAASDGSRRLRSHAVVLVLVATMVVAPAWRWGLKTELVESVYDPGQITYGAMLSPGERALITRAAQELPPDAVVMGEPSNGSAYLWSVGGVRVLYPARPEVAGELGWLSRHLADIHSDPAVCEILRRRGVGYYYSDSAPTDGRDGGVRQPLWSNQLEQLPRDAVTLIDQQGTASLWAITACEE